MTKTLIDRLHPNTPYFEGGTFGQQGNPHRQLGMSATIHKLVELTGGRRLQVLEVGSYAGFSALTWAASLESFCPNGGDILCVDPWAAYVDDKVRPPDVGQWAIMHDERSMDDIYNLFRHNIGTAQSAKVSLNHFRAAGSAALPFLRHGYFDVVYIDGSHLYAPVLSDLKMGQDLVREGGFICGDDLEMQLHEVDQATTREHRERHYIKDPRTGKAHHPGVTVAVAEFFGGPVSAYEGYFYMQKKNGRFVANDVMQGGKSVFGKHFPAEWKQTFAGKRAAG
jgi:predicted O-methyltransferase YrrM